MSQEKRKPRRRRFRIALATVAAVVVLMIAGAAVAVHTVMSTTQYADAGRHVTVKASTVPRLGTVLVTGTDKPLYTYAPDKAHTVTCSGICSLDWPALGVRSANSLVAGPGVDQHQFGTVNSSGSLRVVTYHGWPLYTFSSDRRAKQFTGQGKFAYGGYWYAIRPSGEIVATSSAD